MCAAEAPRLASHPMMASAPPIPRMRARGQLAFVLSGGGSLGAVEVGMLRGLVEAGITPDLVVGASVGAINGAFFAADPTLEGVERLEAIWLGLRRQDVFPLDWWSLLLGGLGRQSHLLSPNPLAGLLRRHLPIDLLETAAVPLCIVATDVHHGTEVHLRTGPAIPALLASTAIPGLFPPVEVDSQVLMDGAVANHTPVSAAIALGATRIVVLPSGFPCAMGRAPHTPVGIALHALNVLTSRQLAQDALRYQARAHIAVIPPLCPLAQAAYEFGGCAELMTRAAEQTRAWLASDGLDAPLGVDGLLPHTHPSARMVPPAGRMNGRGV